MRVRLYAEIEVSDVDVLKLKEKMPTMNIDLDVPTSFCRTSEAFLKQLNGVTEAKVIFIPKMIGSL